MPNIMRASADVESMALLTANTVETTIHSCKLENGSFGGSLGKMVVVDNLYYITPEQIEVMNFAVQHLIDLIRDLDAAIHTEAFHIAAEEAAAQEVADAQA